MTDHASHRSFSVSALLILATGLGLLQSCCDDNGGGGSIFNPSTTANFTATPTSGSRPLTVDFQSTSTGTIDSFLWDFGDGTGSTLENPQHVYTTAGSFDVTLEVSGPGGANSQTQPSLVLVDSPFADPSFESQVPGNAPVAPWLPFFGPGGNTGHVILSAAGGGDLGMPTDLQLWCEIGAESTDDTLPPSTDGAGGGTILSGAGILQEFTCPPGKSVLQFDALFINAEGPGQAARNDWVSFDVTKFVRNGGAQVEDATVNIYRRDTFSPVESLSSLHPGQFATPHEVITVDLEGLFPLITPTTLFRISMQVGNGGDNANPSHAYVDAGRFEPPGPQIVADFAAAPTTVEVGIPIQFADLSTGNPTSWSWDFGDGFASSLQHPSHSYSQAGVYDVSLRATAPGASDQVQKLAFVTVNALQGEVDFDVRPKKVKTNQECQFTNLSSGPFVSFDWSFGDGGVAQQVNPTLDVLHAYAAPGLYTVSLRGNFHDSTIITLVKPDLVLVQDPPGITTQPTDQIVLAGNPALLSIVATGTDITYEWRRNGAVIQGAPSAPNYTTPPNTVANHGDFYTCRVFNHVGTVTSSPAFIFVIP